MTDLALTIVLFFALVGVAIAIVMLRSLFAVVMLSGVFSLLAALLFIVMDAVDVAFTEAAVGAGISSVLMLGTIALTARHEQKVRKWSRRHCSSCCLTGAVLIYGTLDMPAFGDPNAPVQTYVGPDYIKRTPEEIHVPNIVTAVLASYRGYDTMGEVTVVFTAGLGVILLDRWQWFRAAQAFRQAGRPLDGPSPHPARRHETARRADPSVRTLRSVSRRLRPRWRVSGGGDLCGGVHPLRYRLRHRAPARRVSGPGHQILIALGLLLYAGTGIVSLFLGANFLDYNVLAEKGYEGQHIGIILVELGVGVTVFAVMLAIFLRVCRASAVARRQGLVAPCPCFSISISFSAISTIGCSSC